MKYLTFESRVSLSDETNDLLRYTPTRQGSSNGLSIDGFKSLLKVDEVGEKR
jgi:hypothetical protein